MSDERTVEAPSQHREAADHVYAALAVDKDTALKDVVAKSGVERKDAQCVLALAAAGGVASGTNGRWSRSDVSRTRFRDGVVLGAVKAKPRVSMAGLTSALAGLASASQAYGSLARLRDAGAVELVKTETRTPVYRAL